MNTAKAIELSGARISADGCSVSIGKDDQRATVDFRELGERIALLQEIAERARAIRSERRTGDDQGLREFRLGPNSVLRMEVSLDAGGLALVLGLTTHAGIGSNVVLSFEKVCELHLRLSLAIDEMHKRQQEAELTH